MSTPRRGLPAIAVIALLSAACAGQASGTSAASTTVPSPPTSAPVATEPVPTTLPEPASTTTTAPPPPRVLFAESSQIPGIGHSSQVVLEDLDDDGSLDLVVANLDRLEIWLNDGSGALTKQDPDVEAATGFDMSIGVGDLDGDGDPDILLVVEEGPGLVLFNQGGSQGGQAGSFAGSGQQLATSDAWSVALGDLDEDGDLDAYVGRDGSDTVWINDGTGVFGDTGQELGYGVTAGVELADLDEDGDLDAFAGGWDEAGKVWLNDGTGTLSDSGHDHLAGHIHIHGLALGDLDGDGDLDAYLAASGDPNTVWLNDGTGVFTDSGQLLRGPLSHGVALGDLDGDGDLDAFVANGTAGGADNLVWLNDGTGQFPATALRFGSGFSMSVALGDLDDDGDLDAVIANTTFTTPPVETPNELWINQSG